MRANGWEGVDMITSDTGNTQLSLDLVHRVTEIFQNYQRNIYFSFLQNPNVTNIKAWRRLHRKMYLKVGIASSDSKTTKISNKLFLLLLPIATIDL